MSEEVKLKDLVDAIKELKGEEKPKELREILKDLDESSEKLQDWLDESKDLALEHERHSLRVKASNVGDKDEREWVEKWASGQGPTVSSVDAAFSSNDKVEFYGGLREITGSRKDTLAVLPAILTALNNARATHDLSHEEVKKLFESMISQAKFRGRTGSTADFIKDIDSQSRENVINSDKDANKQNTDFVRLLGMNAQSLTDEGFYKLLAYKDYGKTDDLAAALNSLDDLDIAGTTTKSVVQSLRRLGLIDENKNNTHLKELYPRDWKKHLGELTPRSIVSSKLMHEDTSAWLQETLVGNLKDRNIVTSAEIQSSIRQFILDPKQSDLITRIATTPKDGEEHLEQMHNAFGLEAQSKLVAESANAVMQRKDAQAESAQTAAGKAALTTNDGLAKAHTWMSKTVKDELTAHPIIGGVLMGGITLGMGVLHVTKGATALGGGLKDLLKAGKSLIGKGVAEGEKEVAKFAGKEVPALLRASKTARVSRIGKLLENARPVASKAWELVSKADLLGKVRPVVSAVSELGTPLKAVVRTALSGATSEISVASLAEMGLGAAAGTVAAAAAALAMTGYGAVKLGGVYNSRINARFKKNWNAPSMGAWLHDAIAGGFDSTPLPPRKPDAKTTPAPTPITAPVALQKQDGPTLLQSFSNAIPKTNETLAAIRDEVARMRGDLATLAQRQVVLMMDTREVGRAVVNLMGAELQRPASTGSGFDMLRAPLPAGMSYRP